MTICINVCMCVSVQNGGVFDFFCGFPALTHGKRVVSSGGLVVSHPPLPLLYLPLFASMADSFILHKTVNSDN